MSIPLTSATRDQSKRRLLSKNVSCIHYIMQCILSTVRSRSHGHATATVPAAPAVQQVLGAAVANSVKPSSAVEPSELRNDKGACRRKSKAIRDARYAYNHIVESKMLLWLIKVAEVRNELVISARRACKGASSLQQKSAAIRKYIPWDEVETALWSKKRTRNVRRAGTHSSVG